jgi:hypothetical protein
MVFERFEERGYRGRGRVGVHKKSVFVKFAVAVLVKFLKCKTEILSFLNSRYVVLKCVFELDFFC